MIIAIQQAVTALFSIMKTHFHVRAISLWRFMQQYSFYDANQNVFRASYLTGSRVNVICDLFAILDTIYAEWVKTTARINYRVLFTETRLVSFTDK